MEIFSRTSTANGEIGFVQSGNGASLTHVKFETVWTTGFGDLETRGQRTVHQRYDVIFARNRPYDYDVRAFYLGKVKRQQLGYRIQNIYIYIFFF